MRQRSEARSLLLRSHEKPRVDDCGEESGGCCSLLGWDDKVVNGVTIAAATAKPCCGAEFVGSNTGDVPAGKAFGNDEANR